MKEFIVFSKPLDINDIIKVHPGYFTGPCELNIFTSLF